MGHQRLADRNLLFGILAWQNGAIGEPDLLEAMKAWTFDRGTALGEILIRQGVLSQSQVDRLQPMVEA